LPVLHELSALLLMLVGAAMLVLLVLQLELMATMLALLLHVLAPALLYQRACRACASALDRQPLYRRATHVHRINHGLLYSAHDQGWMCALLACIATAGGEMHYLQAAATATSEEDSRDSACAFPTNPPSDC
jgi:hypothetical protein